MYLRNKAIRGVAAGIGLASESISARKANKQGREEARRSAEEGNGVPLEANPQEYDNIQHQRLVEEQHEEEWELDEAQEELIALEHNSNTEPSDYNVDQLAESFLRDLPPHYPAPGNSSLPYPVILPQRRPTSRKRGFIRAYAPVLQDFGIDQTMFLDFLETSNRACQATPWLNAINLASIPTMFLPSALSIALSVVIQLATQAAIAAESRRKTNQFFDKINDEFFRPRGLFCLVMTWDPNSSATYTQFDLNSAISTSIDHGGPGALQKLRHKFKSSDGKTGRDLPFPESAPLIFPALDSLAAQGSEAKFKGLKNRTEFVADYLDRRSQAKFIMKNPDSALNKGPQPKFTSRYADPSHPASSGSLIALVTGGHITSDDLPRRRVAQGFGRRGGLLESRGPIGSVIQAVRSGRGLDQNSQAEAEEYPGAREPGQQRNLGRGGLRQDLQRSELLAEGPIKGAMTFLKSNVLYLMIVNMPSEEEMERAQAALNS